MTQFVWWTGNHNAMGQSSIDDIIMIMSAQLQALGHRSVYDKRNKEWVHGDDGVNVLVEGFTPAVVELIADGHRRGGRYIILATEEPTEKGFNHGIQREMVRRQEMFPEAAKYCEGIIHLVPGDHVTRWYAQFAPSAPAELGYAPALVRRTGDVEPSHDFGFFGSLSEKTHQNPHASRRWKILNRLAKRTGTNVQIVADFPSQQVRDQRMREVKVIVQLRKSEAMGLVSSSRCNTALCLGRPVVAEPHELSRPWDEIVRFSETLEGFFNQCALVSKTWRGEHARQMAAFREKMTPERCLGGALRAIGLESGRRAA